MPFNVIPPEHSWLYFIGLFVLVIACLGFLKLVDFLVHRETPNDPEPVDAVMQNYGF